MKDVLAGSFQLILVGVRYTFISLSFYYNVHISASDCPLYSILEKMFIYLFAKPTFLGSSKVVNRYAILKLGSWIDNCLIILKKVRGKKCSLNLSWFQAAAKTDI